MNKLFFLPIILSLFFLTSCEKDEDCKTCALNFAYANADVENLLDAVAVIEGFSDFESYAEDDLTSNSDVQIGEVCGSAISDSENAWDDFSEDIIGVDLDEDGYTDVVWGYGCN